MGKIISQHDTAHQQLLATFEWLEAADQDGIIEIGGVVTRVISIIVTVDTVPGIITIVVVAEAPCHSGKGNSRTGRFDITPSVESIRVVWHIPTSLKRHIHS